MMMMMIMKVMRVMAASKESDSDKSKYTYVGKVTLESEDDDSSYIDSNPTKVKTTHWHQSIACILSNSGQTNHF
jgi:hypothetical protein